MQTPPRMGGAATIGAIREDLNRPQDSAHAAPPQVPPQPLDRQLAELRFERAVVHVHHQGGAGGDAGGGGDHHHQGGANFPEADAIRQSARRVGVLL